MERVLERHDRWAAGGRAGDLDRILDRFGARVDEHRALLAGAAGRELGESAAHLDVRLVGADDEALVEVLLGLLLHGSDHRRMAMAEVLAADAAREVDERAPVDIRDAGAFRVSDNQARRRHTGGDVPCSVRRDPLRLGALPHGHRAIMHLPKRDFSVYVRRTMSLRTRRCLRFECAGVAQLVEQVICNH